MASKQYQIVLTMNAKQVENYLKTLKEAAESVRNEMTDMTLKDGTPKDAERFSDLAKQLASLDNAIKNTSKELINYEDIIQDLSGAKLSVLRQALRQVKSDMGKVSENSGKMDTLREDYEKITNQIKKLGIEWVNVTDILNNLSSASEKQLRQALSQTRELHASTARNTQEYKDQIDIIEKLEGELNGATGEGKVNTKKVMGNLGGSTVDDIKAAISEMEKLRGATIAGSPAWKDLGDEIKRAKDYLDQFTNPKETFDHTKVMSNLAGATENDIRAAISAMEKLRGEAVAGSPAWKDLSDEIKRAKDHLDQLANPKGTFDYTKVMSNLAGSKENDIRAAISAMEKLRGEAIAGSPAWNNLSNEIKRAKDHLDQLANPKGTFDYTKVMSNLAGSKENDIRAAISAMEKLRGEAVAGSPAWKDLSDEIKRAKDYLDQFTNPKEAFDHIQVMLNLPGSTVNDIRSAISAMEKLRGKTIAGSPEWKLYGDQIKFAKDYLAQFNEEASSGMSESEAEDIGRGIGIEDKTIEELRTAIRLLEKMKEKLKPSDTQGLKDLDAKIARINSQLGNTEEGLIDVKKVLDNLSSAPINDLKKAATQLEKEMNAVNRDTEEYKEKQQQLRRVKDEIESINNSYKKQKSIISQVAQRLSAYVLIYSGFNLIKERLADVVRMNLELSDSLADIRKTTGLANNEVEQLANNLLKLDTRTTAEELNQLAYEAGRMGVGRYGVEGVEGFVRAANQIKVALGEDLGEESIQQVYKLADVMGVIPTLGVEGSLLSIGSALNELTQTGTSSGEFIVDFTSRMAGIARQANLSAAEVAGFGSALDEMGQEVEVSATSMNKFVMQMFTHYSLVAKAADMAPEALKSMLESGKTADAIIAVMEGLRDKGGLSQLAPLFKDLGSDGARLSQTLAAMSSNVDKLKSSLKVARDAFDESRSVTNEYNIKNKTTAALLERIRNSWNELFVNSKNKGAIHDFVEDLKDMSDALQDNSFFMGSLEFAFKSLTLAVKALIALLPTLLTFAGAWAIFNVGRITLIAFRSVGMGVVAMLDLASVGFMRLIGRQAACNASTLRLIATWKSLSTVMKANIFLAIASAIISVVTALSDSHEEVDKSVEDMNRLNTAYNKFNKHLLEEQTRTEGLFKVLKNSKSTRDERAEAIRILNKEYGDYLPNLLTEKSSIDEIKKAQIELNKEMTKGIAMRAKQNAMREVLDPIYEDLSENMGDYTAQFKKNKRLSGYDPGVAAAAIRQLADEGKSANDIFSSVLFNAEIASGYVDTGTYKLSTYGTGAESYNEAKTILMPLIENFVRLKQMIDQINAKFDPLIGDIQNSEDEKTKIVEDDKDKKKKKEKKDVHDSKKDYDALVSDIKAFFELQKAAAFKRFNKGEMSEEDLAAFIREYDKMERSTSQSARFAISDGKVKEWNSFKKDLAGRIHLDNSKDAKNIMKNILDANVTKIHDILSRLGEGEIDAIRKKGTQDARKIQEDQAKFQQEINRLLLAQNYMNENAHKYQGLFEKLGLLSLNRTDSLNEMGGSMSLSASDMKSKWENTINFLREKYEELFYIDINTEEGQKQFRDLISPLKNDFPDIIDMTEDRLKIFFRTIMDFHDADDEARKKAEKDEEKLMRYRFNSMSNTKANENAQSDIEHEMAWMKIMGSVGLSTDSIMADSEVELFKLKLEAAQSYYEYVMTHAEEKANIDKAQQQLDQATMDLTEKLVSQVGKHLAYLKEYGDAIADFGTDFGEAIFGSLSDRQKAVEDLGKAFAKTTQKILLDWVKQRMMQKLQDKLMEKEQDRHLDRMSDKEEQSLTFREAISAIFGKTKVKSEKTINDEVSSEHEKATAKDVQTTSKGAQANASLSAAEGAAKTIAKLGWWGIPLVAVITSLINGLIGMAMSKVSSLFGGSANKAGEIAAPKTKLVSGMLTYDEGNVQQVARYLGTDGVVYTVSKQVGQLETGMVTTPIATQVNGQPSLVGERGPEMVIGRETTAAMMMSRPDLLRDIIQFDKYRSGRSYRTYDVGNVGEFSDAVPLGDQGAMVLQALQELSSVNAALTAQLQRGIRAQINKYGAGGLADEVVDALSFKMAQGNDEKLKRLLRK